MSSSRPLEISLSQNCLGEKKARAEGGNLLQFLCPRTAKSRPPQKRSLILMLNFICVFLSSGRPKEIISHPLFPSTSSLLVVMVTGNDKDGAWGGWVFWDATWQWSIIRRLVFTKAQDKQNPVLALGAPTVFTHTKYWHFGVFSVCVSAHDTVIFKRKHMTPCCQSFLPESATKDE